MTGQVYSWDGLIPVIDPAAFVHPQAVIIGDVHIGPACYVGPGAVLRGDFGRITLMQGSNVQETCVVHSFPGKEVVVGPSAHIGHGAVLHGCWIGTNAMVGMNAVVMDDAMIGENSIVAALAFVKAGSQIPPQSLVAGTPAKILRSLTPNEIEWKSQGTAIYQRLAAEAGQKLRAVQPLAAAEANRKTLPAAHYRPKSRQP